MSERTLIEKEQAEFDGELKLLLALSRRLPQVRGCGRLGGLLMRFYNRKPRPEIVADVLGSRMRLIPRECVDGHLLFCPQLYERPELAALKRHLRAGDVFLDAGANIGFYSLVISAIVGHTGRVIAFEADPENFRRFQENIEMNNCRNIITKNVGLSDADATLRLGLNRSGNQSGHSFLISGDEGVDVQCRPLLDVLNEEGIQQVDAAKFDIEGFEYKVLKRFLESAPARLVPRTIVIEHNLDFVHRAGGDAIELLRKHGFTVTKLKDQDYLAIRSP